MASPDPPPSPAADSCPWLRSRLRRAWLALMWERTWRGTWPAVTLCGLFLAVGLLDLLPVLPPLGHATLLVVFALGLLVALLHAIHAIHLPTLATLIRRLEEGKGGHRPLSALSDPLATGSSDSFTLALWQAHRARMIALAHGLKPGWPRPGVLAQEPWGIRALVILLLVIGLAVTRGRGEEIRHRLARAVHPALPVSQGATVKVWITPPAYTKARPLLLTATGGTGDGIRDEGKASPVGVVPVGSTVLALVLGGRGLPVLAFNERRIPFVSLGDGSHRVETVIEASKDHENIRVVRNGNLLAQWTVTAVPDRVPQVDFTRPPDEAGRFQLRLAFNVADDYGLTALGALIERAHETPLELTLPLSEVRPRLVHTSALQDLTAHPWAGLLVTVRLFARDARGQTGLSEPMTVRLPKRVFTHQVARSIVEERRRMLTEPATFNDMLQRLDEIAAAPAAYDHDRVVFLGLRVARYLVSEDRSDAALTASRTLLWQVALRVEESNTTMVGQTMEEAGQILGAALARKADDTELEWLIERYRHAVGAYLSTLRPAPLLPLPKEWERQHTDLMAMIGQMQELAQAGAREAAGRLLTRVQALMHASELPQP
ncbi:MAG: hypothetical protein FD153_511 [Rhodospirillaceae bacterium]|nr:MAG: hypothetical protein FD153_511 [Rhodospirillaceae bacterium]